MRKKFKKMDRLYWCDGGNFLPGEKSVGQQRGVRLYDGEERVNSLHFLQYFYCN